MKAYLLTLDQPVGICLGFKPNWAKAEVDEYDAVDDGGDNVFIINYKIVVSGEDKMGSIWPEPDLCVWRTEHEFNTWRSELGE